MKSSGGGGISDDMEARVARLEKQFEKIDGKLDAIIKDVAETKGRVAAMPSTWQLMGLILAMMAFAFAIIRFGIPH